jgi:hypothetical protein
VQQVFGDFIPPDGEQEYLIIRFSPMAASLQQLWRNNGLSADFVAEYWATFFASIDALSPQRQIEIKGAINYLANELMENVMKFSYRLTNFPVTLGLYMLETEFRLYSINAMDPQAVEAFQSRIHDLLTGDTKALYVQQLEHNMKNEGEGNSQLGLLTMINDYGVRLAWCFEVPPQRPEQVILTTMVRLDL